MANVIKQSNQEADGQVEEPKKKKKKKSKKEKTDPVQNENTLEEIKPITHSIPKNSALNENEEE